MERYQSLGLVGEGSYGSVLKCRHKGSGRLVAIKKFVDSDADRTVKKIVLREIGLLRKLRHDNLVTLLEVWKRRRRWYLVFEFVERTLLDDLEQNPGGLEPDTGRRFLFQILRAAAFCHQQSIIHRDIKPENILISQGGVVKMCDFGFARTMTSPDEGGVYTDYVATRWYRAPELLVGDTKYGKPVDVWAVGCLLVEMLSGQPLFPGDSDLDQIHHIVRCIGNLTARHQELFYRNPGFSGARLPEYAARVRLEQRFPTISPTALDLAQSCLQMDPEARAQCSELLEHPLFTQDSFHIRFLDELNAKIQRDHRENSTLPKITKTPKPERNEGDDKNRRSKDKKQPEDVDEKVNKEKERKEGEKTEKMKGKQPLKISKTVRNTSEPLTSNKQPKTLGTKISDNAAKTTVAMKGKPRKEPEIPKSTKTLTSCATVVAKPNHANTGSPETREDDLKTTDTNNKDSSFSDNIVPSQDLGKSSNNSNTKVPKLSKSSTINHPNGSSSPKASLKSTIDRTNAHLTLEMSTEYTEGASTSIKSNSDQVETSLTQEPSQESSNALTKPCKTSRTSELQSDRSTVDTEQRRTSECPKVVPSNPKPSKTTSNFVPKMTKNSTSLSTSPSKTLTSDLSRQSTIFEEARPANIPTTPPKGSSNSRLSRTGSSSDTMPNEHSRGFPTDKELTEGSMATKAQQDINEAHGRLAMNRLELSDASGADYKENPGSSNVHSQSTSKSKISTESRTITPNETPQTNSSVSTASPKTLKVSDKENREDSSPSVSISATTLKLSRSSNIEQKKSEAEPNIKSFKPPHFQSLTGETKPKLGSFSKSTSTVTPETQKTARKKRDNPERDDTTTTSFTSTETPDHRSSTRSSVLNEFELRDPRSSPPPPPPPPSSTPLLLPPSSTAHIPSFPPANNHLSQGAAFHAGTHSHRCPDKPRHHGGVYSRLASHVTQAPEKNLLCERSFLSNRCNLGNGGCATTTKKKSDVHFPDLRSSVLPELRAREGKHNKSTLKDQRKDKQPPSEPQQH